MRLFVALPLPAQVRQGLAGLCSGLPGARWIRPENMHVTMRFIGEVDGAGADDAHMALRGVRGWAFPLSLSGLGSFQSGRRLRLLWAGVEDQPVLVRLRDDVETALVRSGLEPERRKFKPHVSLARFNAQPGNKLGPYLDAYGAFSAGPFPVTAFVLMRSHLNRAGAHYEVMADYPLDEE
ncbi:MAG: RNA 2',3'-cyclic phosphodiesterase [Proteobacteria bacterium]|nr:RNA 2',3'-cyclic phosphodiesterase [Pseudomonadota bacterium]